MSNRKTPFQTGNKILLYAALGSAVAVFVIVFLIYAAMYLPPICG